LVEQRCGAYQFGFTTRVRKVPLAHPGRVAARGTSAPRQTASCATPEATRRNDLRTRNHSIAGLRSLRRTTSASTRRVEPDSRAIAPGGCAYASALTYLSRRGLLAGDAGAPADLALPLNCIGRNAITFQPTRPSEAPLRRAGLAWRDARRGERRWPACIIDLHIALDQSLALLDIARVSPHVASTWPAHPSAMTPTRE